MSTHSTNGLSNQKTKLEKSKSETEVRPAKAKRRTFTAKQKLKILMETDELEHGELGGYLRRHGIYSASLSAWRKQKENGVLTSKSSPKRGRTPKSAEAKKVEMLERQVEKLTLKLDQADMIIDAQKKLCEIYGQNPKKGDK